MSEDGCQTFHFFAFYGAPEVQNRCLSWLRLKRLADVAPTLPWLTIVDFNEILSNSNKQGGSLRNESQMVNFCSALTHCSLHELDHNGDDFTWARNRQSMNSIKEKLDWCFVNHLWGSTFSTPQVDHLDYYHSDHRPIAATFSLQQSQPPTHKHHNRFRFEKLLLSDPESKYIIARCWNHNTPDSPIATIIENLTSCAKNLQQWHIGKYGKMKLKISTAQARVTDLNNSVVSTPAQVADLKTSKAILDELLEQEEIYWQQRLEVDWLVMERLKHKPFTTAKVEAALQSMSPDKSPRIDGMSAMFYQRNRTIVGPLVTTVVLSVLNEGVILKDLNRTIITGAKIKSQVYNILVAFELVYAIKHKTNGRNGVVAMKLDMSKAFDRVEWRFIEEVMRKMGFTNGWISLIMTYLTTNSFTFQINCELSSSLEPTRGLHQGCPLSPYLFLICSEGFSRLLQYEESLGNLHGFSLTRHAPTVTHLFFADDSLLFCRANDNSCLAIKRVLDTYRDASGQVLNLDKSVMSFSPNTTLAAQVFFHRQLAIPISECHEQYLGLPAFLGRDKKELFSHVKERIWKLMHN
uniref:Reverse transcriptase domain-containing protein n=1 Tax=Cannabis sativa TaxID=3483 RepID=A0A803QSD6_CANSA